MLWRKCPLAMAATAATARLQNQRRRWDVWRTRGEHVELNHHRALRDCGSSSKTQLRSAEGTVKPLCCVWPWRDFSFVGDLKWTSARLSFCSLTQKHLNESRLILKRQKLEQIKYLLEDNIATAPFFSSKYNSVISLYPYFSLFLSFCLSFSLSHSHHGDNEAPTKKQAYTV